MATDQSNPASDAITDRALRVAETVAERAERIRPKQANYLHHQHVHGGEMVQMMDELAAISAMRFTGTFCLTAHISSVDFNDSIPVGHVAEMTAYVYDTGDTSLQLYVSVDHRDPRQEETTQATEASFVLVAVDEDYQPRHVPELRAETTVDQDLLEAVPY